MNIFMKIQLIQSGEASCKIIPVVSNHKVKHFGKTKNLFCILIYIQKLMFPKSKIKQTFMGGCNLVLR